MPGHRVQVQDFDRRTLRPVARPADTFVQPTPSRASQVTRGLSALSGELDSLANLLEQKQSQRETLAGQSFASAVRAEFNTFEEAVAAGRITENENPFFVRAARTQFGRHAADAYLARLSELELTLADQTDTAEFQRQAQEVRNTLLDELRITDEDQAFLRGFNPRADSHLLNKFSNQLKITSETAKNKIQESHFRIVSTNIMAGLSSEQSMEEIGADITIETNMKLGALGGRRANNSTIDAVTAAALQTGNLGVLDILKHVDTGSGNLAGTQYGRDQIRQTKHRILLDTNEAMRSEEFRDRVARERAVRQFNAELQETQQEDGFVLTPSIIADWKDRAVAMGIPGVIPGLNALMTSSANNAAPAVVGAEEDYFRRIWDDTDDESLDDILGQATSQAGIEELGLAGRARVVREVLSRIEAGEAPAGARSQVTDRILAAQLPRLRRSMAPSGILSSMSAAQGKWVTAAEHALIAEFRYYIDNEGADDSIQQVELFAQALTVSMADRYELPFANITGIPPGSPHYGHELLLDPADAARFGRELADLQEELGRLGGVVVPSLEMFAAAKAFGVENADVLDWVRDQAIHALRGQF